MDRFSLAWWVAWFTHMVMYWLGFYTCYWFM